MLQPLVQFLNRPNVKENVKEITGSITCLFGLVQIYDTVRKQAYSPKWVLSAKKIPEICARWSLIFSALTSRPCLKTLSHLNLIGPTPTFAANRCHPRHIASLAAVGLSLPLLAQALYQNLIHHPAKSAETKLCAMIFFNILTSRPTLHLGNQLAHRMLHSAV